MKIVLFTRPAWLDPTLPLACALAAEHEVSLFVEIAPEHRSHELLDVPLPPLPTGIAPALCVLREGGGLPRALEAELRRLAGFHLVVHTGRRVYGPKALLTGLRAGALVRRLMPDVIHLDDFTGRVLPVLYAARSVPVVASLHDVVLHTGEAVGRFHTIRRLGLRRTDALIFHSRHAATTFAAGGDYGGFRLPGEVIPLGVYSLPRCWDSGDVAEQERTVLFWGRLSPYKGLDDLWRAAELVARRIPGVRFVVAGAPVAGYAPPVPPRLANGGVFDLRFRHIPNRETSDLFRQCALVVLPYTEATQSGVVATALAFGKPVVATNVGGLPEMIAPSGAGRLVPPRSPEALAEAIGDLLERPAERQTLAANARRVARDELSWPRLAAATAGVYAMARKRARGEP
jgi:glycosyltransferase involved in cell wall biosynthesis